jgi:hypothetical protein
MSNHSDDPKAVHERVSLGGDAHAQARKRGFTMARSGHVAVPFGAVLSGLLRALPELGAGSRK